ncbi:unnamed protein product [Merluccius merluccius]
MTGSWHLLLGVLVGRALMTTEVAKRSCLPCVTGRKCLRAKRTASISRWFICHPCCAVPQCPRAVLPSQTAPQPDREASVVMVTLLPSWPRGTPSRTACDRLHHLRTLTPSSDRTLNCRRYPNSRVLITHGQEVHWSQAFSWVMEKASSSGCAPSGALAGLYCPIPSTSVPLLDLPLMLGNPLPQPSKTPGGALFHGTSPLGVSMPLQRTLNSRSRWPRPRLPRPVNGLCAQPDLLGLIQRSLYLWPEHVSRGNSSL